MRIYNYPLCEKANQIQLILTRYARAVVGTEWRGAFSALSFSALYYVLDGSAIFEVDGGVLETTAGNWYLLPSGIDYKFRCEGHFDQLSFHLSLCAKDRKDLLLQCKKVLMLPAPLPTVLLECLSEKEDVNTALRVRQVVYETLLTILEENGVKLRLAQYSLPVSRAMEYIDSHLSAQLTSTKIAEEAGVSKSTLSKYFKKELSMTVQEYLYDVLLSKASHLLLTEKDPVSKISESLGFSDQFYFSKRFRAKYGKSPRAYKKTFS